MQTDTFYSDAHFAQMFSVDPAKDEKGAPLAVYLAGIHAEDVEQVTGALNRALATGEKRKVHPGIPAAPEGRNGPLGRGVWQVPE